MTTLENSPDPLPQQPDIVYRIMESNGDALTSIESVVASATREIRIFDSLPSTLRDRDFGRPNRIEALKTLLLKNRASRIRIALHEVTAMESELPRLLLLMQLHSTQVQIHRTVGQAREAHDVMLIADDAHSWRKPYFEHPRSVLTLNDPAATKPFIDRFEEIWDSTELVSVGGATGL
jgi:hypothetical protein